MAALTRLVARSGAPVIRAGVDIAMRVLGEQFVCGETIEAAIAHARRLEARGYRYSYDMLGEAAATAEDAERYLAVLPSGAGGDRRGLGAGAASTKGPACRSSSRRCIRAMRAASARRVMTRALSAAEAPRRPGPVARRRLQHRRGRIGAARPVARPAGDACAAIRRWRRGTASASSSRPIRSAPSPSSTGSSTSRAPPSGASCCGWSRAPIGTARSSARRSRGWRASPVFTRKIHTDVAYLACAKRLLAAPDAIYPQFATHNALTLATVRAMAGENFYAGQYEFQCLHGMGEPLYDQIVGPAPDGRPCRIYAPVGSHETLLAYLVRRLLENGANTSFVNRIADAAVPVEALIEDPVAAARALAPIGAPHPKIAAAQRSVSPGARQFGRARPHQRGAPRQARPKRSPTARAAIGALAAKARRRERSSTPPTPATLSVGSSTPSATTSSAPSPPPRAPPRPGRRARPRSARTSSSPQRRASRPKRSGSPA